MSTDSDEVSQQEGLDEDNLRVDPLEAGVEPPERWAESDRFGTTLREQREGQDMDERLAAEEPDVPLSTRPGAETPLSQLSDRIDEPTDDVDQVAPPEQTDEVLSEAAGRGQSADEAGGSVAEVVREEVPLDEDAGDRAVDSDVREELR
ncbi:hypothetical protein [Actinokineospora bangkokensis]|uniref:DUF5709 domain-containing protein n=1 Tax=Actinokineospora bangkokensis TaxID=1193682 RepID=A0A1Q9LL40_9PSEU|nr:hypothetical protein [Actinokineospora bangkokensis]OLR92699.1 hypothetical protein BJP25_22005 [Actinokineospora bangkokensis]